MCGIVGLIGDCQSAFADPIGRALSTLRLRGPDGGHRTTHQLGIHAATFGARHLALVDPQFARQPIVRPSGAALVWNGEVYNHRQLRSVLEDRGEVFESENDGEVLAALLDRDGMDALSRIEGSYAFAFLGSPRGPLFLGRDALGVRPLVYARLPQGLVFASTVDALVAMGVFEPVPELNAISDVLRDGVVPSHRTALRGVHRVPQNTTIAFDVNLHSWSQPIDDPTAGKRDVEAIGEPKPVLDQLRAAVRDRLAVERPAGVLLSGGVDSGLIAALASEDHRLPLFTMGFPGHVSLDESARAKRTAARLRQEHIVVPCPDDPTPWVLGMVNAFDEPFADSSAVPAWGMARAMRSRVRVALTGTGGDEVFGGYRRYWLVGAGPWLRHVPEFVRGPVRRALERRAPGSARVLGAVDDPEGFYRGLLRLRPIDEVRRVMGPLLSRTAEPEHRTGPKSARAAMDDDVMRYLPDDLLVKEDRAFMAHAIEGRHPFLDRRVIRAARDLEIRVGPGRGQQKHILRAYVRDVIDEDLARVAKRGFAFPVDALYRGALRPLAEDALLGQRARERGFVSPVGVRRLFRAHLVGRINAGQIIHALVVLELWARRTLDRRSFRTPV